MVGVEDFDVAGYGLLGAGKGEGVESADFRGDFFAEGGGGVESEELAGGAVEEEDFAVGVEDDESLVKGFEDVFEKAFFLDEAGDDLLDFAGFDAVEAGDEFVEETGFHGAEDGGWGDFLQCGMFGFGIDVAVWIWRMGL